MNGTPAAVRRRRIARMLARKNPPAWTEIAEREGISVQLARRIMANKDRAPNPTGEAVPYTCAKCGGSSTSTNKHPPARCPLCKAYRWRVVALAALVLLALAPPPSRAQQPDVAVIVLDDATTRLFDATPALAELAARGVRFSATTPAPLCGPSRASLLTGLHAHNTGVRGNEGNEEAWEAARGESLPVWFQRAGYTTIRAGKPNDVNGGGPDTAGWSRVVRRPADGAVHYLTKLGRRTARAVGRARAQGAPVFLYLAPGHDWSNPTPERLGTHAEVPLPLPGNFNEADVSDKRWGVDLLPPLMPEEIDLLTAEWRLALDTADSLADLVARVLTEFGPDTVIVVTSDNGHEWGEHRIPDGKGRHFEESSQVPLVVVAPGVAPAASDALVYVMDLAPTVAELAGLQTPELDARSLVPLLADPAAPWRARVLLEHRYVGTRTHRRKLVVWDNGDRELYALDRDPWELRNRCARGDDACGAALDPFIAELAACRGASCWEAETRQGDDEP